MLLEADASDDSDDLLLMITIYWTITGTWVPTNAPYLLQDFQPWLFGMILFKPDPCWFVKKAKRHIIERSGQLHVNRS